MTDEPKPNVLGILPEPGKKGRRYKLKLKTGTSIFETVANRFPYILPRSSHLHFVNDPHFPEVHFTTTDDELLRMIYTDMMPDECFTTELETHMVIKQENCTIIG